VDRAIVATWIAGAVALAAALSSGSALWTDVVVGSWMLSTMIVGSYLLVLMLRIRRGASKDSLRLVGPIGVLGFVVLLRDVALTIGLPAGPTWLFAPYVCAVVGLWGGWRIVERFVENLDAYQSLNRDLERRVDERGDQIARGYERIHALERERAIQDERVRLMRDIHDGFGSQLTSMLALVEQTDAPSTDLADALRDALDDMRLVVYSLAPRDADLIALLASWRARIERRLQRHGLRFEWQVSDVPPLPWLGPRESLQVLRIVQETISTVVQHAGATTITVRTAVGRGPDGRDGVVLDIGDDGCGFTSADDRSGAGNGLRNMASRAHDVGGVVSFSGEAAGARVSLWLPLAR
jgi:signal transduction histidine kinase